MEAHDSGSSKTAWLYAALAVAVFAAGALAFFIGRMTADDASPSGLAAREADVATRGSTVMPFDLEQTTHTFQKTSDGGLQTVTADDPDDAEQSRLIRGHLSAEAQRFAAGDFSDPAGIHGAAMPGLAALSASAGAITIEYSEVPAGAAIRYATSDAALVSALHLWFDAQVSDHGQHASHGE